MYHTFYFQELGLEECERRIAVLVRECKVKGGLNPDTPLTSLVNKLNLAPSRKNLKNLVNHIFVVTHMHVRLGGNWLSEWLRRWSNKPDVVGSIPVTTEFF